ncbi:hypothetical protein, partial [Frankia sp. R82]|uniref:hypothetical protein n=1 Tax=Frankia sp. R82 TaxID=2950553 RepID=UPI0020431446
MTDPQRCPQPGCRGVLADGRCPLCGQTRHPDGASARPTAAPPPTVAPRPSVIPPVTLQPV